MSIARRDLYIHVPSSLFVPFPSSLSYQAHNATANMSDTIRNMDGAGSAIDYWPSSHAHMELDLHSRSPMQSIIGRKRGRSLTSKQHSEL